jgi:hypothetical protein
MLENTEGAMQKDNLCLVYPMLPVSLDCPFALPLRYSLTCICPVSCVPYAASFSGLSFCIAPSVFSNIYLSCVLCTLCCQFLWRRSKTKGQSRETGSIGYTQDTGQINVREYRRGNAKGQSRETGSIGYTRHRTYTCFLWIVLFFTLSVFSNMYMSCVLCTLCCQFLWIVLLHCPFGIL